MKNLIATNPGMFPLRSSLFWHDPQGGGWQGTGYRATWELLHRGFNADYRNRLVDAQIRYKSNFMTWYLYHFDDPNCNINPFVGCPSPEQIATGKVIWDWEEIIKWMPYFELGKNSDYWIVPSILCGDSRRATNNTAFHDMFIPPVVQALHPLIKGVNLGSEMTKTMTWAQIGRMARVVKNAWMAAGQQPRFVLVHMQCDGEGNFRDCSGKIGFPSDVDAVMLETSNHPKNYRDGNDLCAEIKKAVTKCPVYLLISETYIFCEEDKSRRNVREIAKIPGVWGLPGPS